MRRIVDVLLALMVVGIAGGTVALVQHDRSEDALRDAARSDARRFQQQVSLQTALTEGQTGERGFPATVDPAWFNGNPPSNPLLPPTHPWVEIASPANRDALHPPEVVAMNQRMARFWYNPYNGIIRARVPMCLSDAMTIELYNYVNDSSISSLLPQRSGG